MTETASGQNMTGDQRPEIVERLRENAEIKSGEAWRRMDGGQDLSIGSSLATEAADLIEEMLAALIQCTSRADADLKKHFSGRTDACARDYAMCMAAIARATGAA